MEDRLAEMDLGVVGVESQPSGTRVQSRRKVSEHLVAAGDQGEELPHDRIGGGRSAEGALEMAQSGRPILLLDPGQCIASMSPRMLNSKMRRFRKAGVKLQCLLDRTA